MQLSVIIPAYNVENYIKECIEKILDQRNCDFEVIIVDDGSSDETLAIAKQFESETVKVISQRNQGSGIARNTGLTASQGEYVYFVDPDDKIVPNMFSDIFNKMSQKQYDVIQFSYSCFSENGEKWIQNQLNSTQQEFLTNKEILDSIMVFSKQTNVYSVWTKIVKREFLIRNGIQFSNQKTGQDALFVIEIFKKVNSLLWIPKRYYQYLVNRENSAQTVRSYNTILDDIQILNNLYHFQKDYELKYDIFSGFAVYILEKELRYIDANAKKYSVFKKMLGDSKLNSQIYRIEKEGLTLKQKIFLVCRKYSLPMLYCYYRRNFQNDKQ